MSKQSLKIFYGGACPFCRDEMLRLRQWDRAGRLDFENIQADDFDPSRYGVSLDELMRLVHVQTERGRTYRGVEAIQLIYNAVGKGWLVWITRIPWLRPGFDRCYSSFARNRMFWSSLMRRKPCTGDQCNLP